MINGPDGWRLQSSSAPQHQMDLHKGVPASKSGSQVIWACLTATDFSKLS